MILEVGHPNLLIGELSQVQALKQPQSVATPAFLSNILHKEQFIAELMMRPC